MLLGGTHRREWKEQCNDFRVNVIRVVPYFTSIHCANNDNNKNIDGSSYAAYPCVQAKVYVHCIPPS